MAISQKFGRTFHYPFSPGTTSDDRISHDYWEHIIQIPALVHTEKLDGENNCLSRHGVFARSHAAPVSSDWTKSIRLFWQTVRNDIGDLEIFLENLYAVHSIRYRQLDHHFYVFAVREHGCWLSWEETKFYAAMLDLPVVPEIAVVPAPQDRMVFEQELKQTAAGRGAFDPVNAATGIETTMEGIVSRNAESYRAEDFSRNVFKYVRKGHVQTDQHWTRNWKRAPLKNEGGKHVDAHWK